MKRLIFVIPLFVVAIVSGCKTNTTSTPAAPVVVIPNVGSNWTIQNVRRDSTGAIKKTDTSVRTVAAINLTYQGFSDVVMTYETNPVTGKNDTVYLRYLASGDIAHLSSPAIDPQLPEWLTVPFYTHTPQNLNWGATISYLGFTHDSVTFTSTYLNNDNDTIAGVIYPISQATSTVWQKATSAAKDSTNYVVQTTSFIPSKGFFGGRKVSMNQVNGKQFNIVDQTVIKVDLK